jgi:hypothetical protein
VATFVECAASICPVTVNPFAEAPVVIAEVVTVIAFSLSATLFDSPLEHAFNNNTAEVIAGINNNFL